VSEVRVVPRRYPPRLMAGLANEFWNGRPERLPDGFTLTKAVGVHMHAAVCEVWTNPAGWELRLITNGQSRPITTVVRSADEMRALVETWQTTMRENGWR
jgi:hypothetical protein